MTQASIGVGTSAWGPRGANRDDDLRRRVIVGCGSGEPGVVAGLFYEGFAYDSEVKFCSENKGKHERITR